MRGPPVCLRALTAEERSAVETLSRSRTAPARQVERARVVLRASRGETPPGIAEALGLGAETVRRRSRIDEILLKAGLRWRRQETWFGARVDPEFAEKRGASRRSTPHHPRAA